MESSAADQAAAVSPVTRRNGERAVGVGGVISSAPRGRLHPFWREAASAVGGGRSRPPPDTDTTAAMNATTLSIRLFARASFREHITAESAPRTSRQADNRTACPVRRLRHETKTHPPPLPHESRCPARRHCTPKGSFTI
ncbi:hypothetical protein GCM10010286_45140 [Streptomyces toxytricini]|nr:hypothetical protein GCM10010286_45140 [Streptomyces toxytricini]